MSPLPAVIQNKIKKWKILSYGEKDWCNAFEGKKLKFRKGDKIYRETPLWEQLCDEENISLNEFFDISRSKDESTYWLYYDYKYMKYVFPETSDLLKEINWSDLGINHLSGNDSTIWIGNKGAHTPCHMDTYGCNLVAQILGRKLWILIPPKETDSLCPVRVPYEESSIYSSHNFFTPNLDLLKIKTAYKVILNPGDVLYIPKHWWHYVENLEVAISVNIWIPEESDAESRLEEALVRQYVSTVCQSLIDSDAKTLLNPNEYDLLTSPFEQEALQLFLTDFKKVKNGEPGASHMLSEFKEILSKNAVDIPCFPPEKIKEYVEAKRKDPSHSSCSVPSMKSGESKQDNVLISKMLINSYCHPEIVTKIKEKLLELN